MNPLWTVDDVAAYLKVPVKTLYDWRTRDYGPKGKRVGKYLRYKAEEVIAWFESLDPEAA
ncbi:hypothetical protein GCM10027598_07780 [Amycolatopsis oliviviridis]|uniref:Helix-turn-helix domain-containing protein n=1 Tax=Amycolatopsis oliviviridis TaxID=1471590 RepID=A0ABQ3LNN2_9PSEU|nr:MULTISPECIES: helix-turn-helix domain-containing protein [Amycolatopsis]RSM75213.1 DNA-binding protein [Amycolatopsis sp. WAC 01375]GHH20842.1 hypothetical protein GCM10017790_41190 [Amycolatopsis oliviviridis]